MSLSPLPPPATRYFATIQGKDIAYTFVKLLACGAFGTVYHAIVDGTGASLAVKVVDTRNKHVLFTIQREIAILQSLDHPHILRLLGSVQVNSSMHLVMEYVGGNSLRFLLNHLRQSRKTFSTSAQCTTDAVPSLLPYNLIPLFTKSLLEALCYAHSRQIVHRDVKAENILLSASGVILADWGSAKYIGDPDPEHKHPSFAPYLTASSTFHYSPLWMAPEVPVYYNHKVDIWGVGCVVLELLTGLYPWEELHFSDPAQARNYISLTGCLPAFPAWIPEDLRQFLLLCFERNPNKRPEVQELLQHPFLTGKSIVDNGQNSASLPLPLSESKKELASSIPIKMRETKELKAPIPIKMRETKEELKASIPLSVYQSKELAPQTQTYTLKRKTVQIDFAVKKQFSAEERPQKIQKVVPRQIDLEYPS